MTKLRWLLTPLATVLACELWSLLAVNSIHVSQGAYPWDFVTVLSYGFIAPIITSSIVVTVLSCLIYAWYQGGIYRIAATYSAVLVSSLAAAWMLGILLFCEWDHCSFLTFLPFYNILSFIPQGTRHFHLIVCLTLSMSAAMAIAGYLLFRNLHLRQQPFGHAHFANRLEMTKAGFFSKNPESIIMGKKYQAPLYANGFEHVLVFAPTGSGKTTRIAIPNLFHFPYSCVVNDVKLTLFNTTSQYRETVLKNRCYAWVLSNSHGKTHRYNPLSVIDPEPIKRMSDVQRMAHILIPDGKGDPIWYQSSRKLFKALVLYLLDHPDKIATLGELSRLVKQPQFDAWLTDALQHSQGFDPEFYRNGFSYLENHPKTRASILETFSGYLELFDDPLIDAATHASDFDMSKLRQEKMTIYVGFNTDDTKRLSPLLTLFWEQVIGVMVREVPNVQLEPYPVLCLIDEFSSLGKLERLRQALSLLREYRVRCVLMLQYMAQTKERYTADEAQAFWNIKTKIAFTPDSREDAEWISKLLGTKTIKVDAGAVNAHQQGSSRTHSFNYQAAPLLRPDEVMALPKTITLIMRAGLSPVKADSFVWYQEASMKALAQGAVELPVRPLAQVPFSHAVMQNESEAG